jgi:hypothetical protein
MSLDVYLIAARPTNVYSANITHNLNKMAEAAGIYDVTSPTGQCLDEFVAF